jgi:hypothetical protein
MTKLIFIFCIFISCGVHQTPHEGFYLKDPPFLYRLTTSSSSWAGGGDHSQFQIIKENKIIFDTIFPDNNFWTFDTFRVDNRIVVLSKQEHRTFEPGDSSLLAFGEISNVFFKNKPTISARRSVTDSVVNLLILANDVQLKLSNTGRLINTKPWKIQLKKNNQIYIISKTNTVEETFNLKMDALSYTKLVNYLTK